MLKAPSSSSSSSASAASPLVAPASSSGSGLGLGEGKAISALGSLVLSGSAVGDHGLLRSPTTASMELRRSAAALNDERRALALLLQNAITGYVMLKEGRDNYKGKGHYDLPYIQSSTVVKAHRKRDIAAIDALINEAEAKALPPVTLASALYAHLNTIQTGMKFLWLFRMGNSSDLRNHLHAGIKSFDPMLYWVCFIDQVENYHQYQRQKPDTAKLRLASSMKAELQTSGVSVELYQQLKIELMATKRDLVDVKDLHAELEGENVALSASINSQRQRIYELEILTGEHRSSAATAVAPTISSGGVAVDRTAGSSAVVVSAAAMTAAR